MSIDWLIDWFGIAGHSTPWYYYAIIWHRYYSIVCSEITFGFYIAYEWQSSFIITTSVFHSVISWLESTLMDQYIDLFGLNSWPIWNMRRLWCQFGIYVTMLCLSASYPLCVYDLILDRTATGAWYINYDVIYQSILVSVYNTHIGWWVVKWVRKISYITSMD